MGNRGFWKGKRVLVTGHTGFKGTWLVLLLKKLEATLCGYALPAAPKSLYLAADPKIDCEYIADIRNDQEIEKALQEFQPEIIFHLASVAFIQPAIKDPKTAYSTNVLGLVNLLDGIRRLNSVKGIVVVTSDKCYKSRDLGKACNESDELGAGDTYSTTKACQEFVAENYRKTYCNDVDSPFIATARASNVLGGGDFHQEHLVPYLVSCFMQRQVPNIHNPWMIRSWQYVLDVLWGYLLLGKSLFNREPECGSAFNFGPREDGVISVECLVDEISKYFPMVSYKVEPNRGFHETGQLKIVSKRATEILGWKPLYSLKETVERVVRFYQDTYHRENILDICDRYIQEYVEQIEKCDAAAS